MDSSLAQNMVQWAGEQGISIGKDEASLFARYLELLVEWNAKVNLTAIDDPREIVIKHFLDSISVIPHIEGPPGAVRLIDVGTGGGFPGVPIKIMRPQWEVVLLDSLNKRITFLNHLIGELGLSGIAAIHGRAEDIGRRPEYREKFNVVTSRAVARLNVLSELCLPLTEAGGVFISFKGPDVREELLEARGAVQKLGGQPAREIKLQLPQKEGERTLVVVKKIAHTPAQYPRKAGTPEKRPLL